MLHREQLATKDLCPELKGDVLETAVRIVNDIKAKPLPARIFTVFSYVETVTLTMRYSSFTHQ